MERGLVRSFEKGSQSRSYVCFVLEYDRLKHEKCTLELGQYIFECAALNIVDKQYSNRKSLSNEDCRFVRTLLDRQSLIVVGKLFDVFIFQHDHPSQGLSDGETEGMLGIRCSWSDFLR